MWYKYDAETVTLNLHVQPGARHNEIVGLHGDSLKIRLAAPPIDGRANETLLKYMAMLFNVPLRQVALRQGKKSRRKVVVITGSKIEPTQILILNTSVLCENK